MNEKVKLPKFVCDWLDQHKEELCGYPMADVSKLSKERDTVGDVKFWLLSDTNTQWKLIDALRYGYEAEPEQLYYVIMPIDRTHCFLNQNEDDGEVFFDEKDAVMRIKVKFTMPEILAIDPRYKAFAVPVEEVDECTN
ncbi:conserved protein of unknown function [Latilactobacillus sakei]|uniref:DUF1642 domain-containing protein n=1 Tax=Latilactobacillus sakei TaxID=1599 RepID=UPI000C6F286D|nr:DUF1642 domain-containing protein [Latilactobacillus sakei]SON67246.1 conserved protein of unknown function [Latilactobacillus sakei]